MECTWRVLCICEVVFFNFLKAGVLISRGFYFDSFNRRSQRSGAAETSPDVPFRTCLEFA